MDERAPLPRRSDDAWADEEEAYLTDWYLARGVPMEHGMGHVDRMTWDQNRAVVRP